MLYHIDVDIDYAAMGERKEALLAAEWQRTAELRDQGIAVTEFRRADTRGVIAVWDCRSHDHLNDILRGLPIYPYLTDIRVTALIDHPLFPTSRPPKPSESR